MSNLFRNLAALYQTPNAEEKAFKLLIRKTALLQIGPKIKTATANQAEAWLQKRAVINQTGIGNFLNETKNFISDLFRLVGRLDSEKCLDKKEYWRYRLQAVNKDLPTMFELNKTLKALAESYRLKKITPEKLGEEIKKLCAFPKY